MSISVTTIAYTQVDFLSAIASYMELDCRSSEMEDVIEFAGRACYQSFHKPNPATARNEAYIANLLAQGHESVLEHASVSFYVQGVSRNLLLELERHRHLSFSVLSQRFVSPSHTQFVYHPTLEEQLDPSELREIEADFLSRTTELYDKLHTRLREEGLERKQAREAARSVLPGGIETKFVVTGNLRAWRDVLKKRYNVHADLEIRQFSEIVLTRLQSLAPAVFQDFPEEPFSC